MTDNDLVRRLLEFADDLEPASEYYAREIADVRLGCDRLSALSAENERLTAALAATQAGEAVADWELELARKREFLLLASYCGGDNPDCSEAKPCSVCLGMSNVFTVPPETQLTYKRQLAPEWNVNALASQPAVSEPSGWKLVPIEPTKEMLSAIAHADWSGKDDLTWADGYRIMLAASPQGGRE